jgi:putative SOS response-associated peptidase YedK
MPFGEAIPMCGRYSLTTELEALRQLFNFANRPNFAPRYNVAPTQRMPVVRRSDSGERELAILRWGLIPSWARDAQIGSKCINARADTAAEKPSFRGAFRARRCLVPADGFYEWKGEGGAKQPYLIRAPGGRPFAFAGLWERWTAKAAGAGIAAGETVETYTILTTDANAKLMALHERMPVILAPADYAAWLDGSKGGELLRPCPDAAVEYFPVSRRVNSVKNDDPECMVPLAA